MARFEDEFADLGDGRMSRTTPDGRIYVYDQNGAVVVTGTAQPEQQIKTGDVIKTVSMEGLKRAFEAVTPRALGIPEGTAVIQLELRPAVAEIMSIGDLIKLQTDGPLHTVLGKQGNTVFLVEGSYRRKFTGSYDRFDGDASTLGPDWRKLIPLDQDLLPSWKKPESPAPKQKKEFRPVVGKRRIRLDE